MPGTGQGSIRIFRIAGITVFLHWTWFLFAIFEVNARAGSYSSLVWNVLEYLSLFLIVTLHEFGHALACRQVGGRANQIVLWPLGGVAYVDPPPRPGATLWSIAAGPLVNVALLPILLSVLILGRYLGWPATAPDVYRLVRAVCIIDAVLLVFNMLPVYPLDGGQILRSVLWFAIGRARSLMVATVVGFVGVAGFLVVAFWIHSVWYGVLAIFMLLNCWGGLKHALALSRMAKLPRRDGFLCPKCRTAPPVGEHWRCSRCNQAFDTFQTAATCPYCAAQYPVTTCMDCGAANPVSEWAGISQTSPKHPSEVVGEVTS
jgi:Zn-dependent protease